MTDVNLPTEVIECILRVHGHNGARWVRDLPPLVDHLMEKWSLVSLGVPFARAPAGLVVPAHRRTGAELVLKAVPAPKWLNNEAAALDHWAGRGAVKLIAVERKRGALLLERLTPGDSLLSLSKSDDRAATAAVASVIAELRAVRRSRRPALPRLTSWIAALPDADAQGTFAELRDAAERASSIARDLLAESTDIVLHGDLQHYNILNAEREPWLAIDPKGLIGPAEAEPAALLRNPRRLLLSHTKPQRLLADLIAVLAERLGDDPRRLVLWGYALAVVAAAWAFEDQEPDLDVQRWLACAAVLWQVASEAHAV